jgi:hypothetical protein
MKNVIQGLFLATLISAAHASPFPMDGEAVSIPAQSTYTDQSADKGNVAGGAFPVSAEEASVPAQWTHAERNAVAGDIQVGSAFPMDGEAVSIAARSTYADA